MESKIITDTISGLEKIIARRHLVLRQNQNAMKHGKLNGFIYDLTDYKRQQEELELLERALALL